ncbi:MAG: di-trans,poly-cis-decaprenylcistransferase, partial [Actinobacteria bacterium]|nr:di-trans,poly-cis-decaprenylcistransferase [Actinomycetota bacterium]
MRLPHPMYGLYERRLAASLPVDRVPRHVGVILDGNRRWARSVGLSSATGHRAGAQKIADLLEWSEAIGVEVVTLWMLSTDNLSRDPEELDALLEIIEDTVLELASCGRWRLQPMGSLDRLPDHTVDALRAAQERTAGVVGLHVNVAVGYGGRQEITDAVRAVLRQQAAAGTSLEELAEAFEVDHIAEHLYTKGQPDPELMIRTSGEQR